jgi:hypothetical protein
MNEVDIIKRIVEIEYELTLAVRNGHKASDTDKYSKKRNEVDMLRCLYFGLSSTYCKIKKEVN